LSTPRPIVIGLVVLVGAIRAWQSHEHAVSARELQAIADRNGFVPVQMPDGAARDTILILAPLNCPSAGARRADALAARLSALGVPTVRLNQYAISAPTADMQSGIKHAFAILKGDIPAVMINGRAKANPTAEEVLNEYRHE
jgi:hypothetical protein